MSKENCIFCQMISGRRNCITIYEDEVSKVIAPLKKDIIAKGALIIFPKHHTETLFEIPEEELKQFIISVKKVSVMLQNLLKIKGINILHASGIAAQQSVFHLHFHLIPRTIDDGMDLWPKTDFIEEEYPNRYLEMQSTLNSRKLKKSESSPAWSTEILFKIYKKNGIQKTKSIIFTHKEDNEEQDLLELIEEICDQEQMSFMTISIQTDHGQIISEEELLKPIKNIINKCGKSYIIIQKE